MTNSIRGYAAEFGLTAATGLDKIEPLLGRIAADGQVPELARELFGDYARDYARLEAQIRAIEIKLMAWHRGNELSRRLTKIPGVGPVVASMLVMKTPDPKAFRSPRHFAAWIGLTPKDHSTAGKTRLGVITRAGDEALRSLLVVGATSVVQQVGKSRGNPSLWLIELAQGEARRRRSANNDRCRIRLEDDGHEMPIPRSVWWRR